jgi:hypothetical protein
VSTPNFTLKTAPDSFHSQASKIYQHPSALLLVQQALLQRTNARSIRRHCLADQEPLNTDRKPA